MRTATGNFTGNVTGSVEPFESTTEFTTVHHLVLGLQGHWSGGVAKLHRETFIWPSLSRPIYSVTLDTSFLPDVSLRGQTH